ncbi:MAG: LTA synthase family protein [Myxococcota bacterium]
MERERLVRRLTLAFRATGLSLTSWIVLVVAVRSVSRLEDTTTLFFLSDADQHLHVATTLPALVALCVLVQHLVPAQRAVAFAVNAFFITLYSVLAHIHIEHKVSLDYAVVAQYAGQFLRSGTREFVLASVPVGTFALAAGVVALELATRQLSVTVRARRRLLGIASSASAYLVLVFAVPFPPQDEYSALLRGSFEFHFGRADWMEPHGTDRYPYVVAGPTAAADAAGATEDRPHVFVVLLESFNAGFVGSTTADGREVTPFFDAKIDEGVYVEDFYGNSVQSIQGYFTLLTSVLPSFRGRLVTDYAQLRMRGLPEILSEAGYRTGYWSGYTDLDFDDVGRLMTVLGMQSVRAMERASAREEDLPFYWGWGLQDDVFYRRFFEDLDRRHAERAGDAPRFFSLLAGTSHHDPFDQMPEELRLLHPEPDGRREECVNSLHLLDRYLRTFFDELERRPYLENSLVVLVGDHGFPVGEHGLHHNEVAFYQEFFRTPLLLLWNGRLAPRRIAGGPFSQVDVAPTVLGLLGIETRHHFTGRDVFAPGPPVERPVHLIQPYSGTYLATLLPPFKYVRHLGTDRRYLFDLQRDPGESADLAGDPAFGGTLERMRRLQEAVFLNQKLLREDRLWPADPSARR